jgi:EmrB/QacA subfamily drug resistance transporter
MTKRVSDHPLRTLAILCAAAATFSLTQTLVVPALPSVQRQYGVDASHSIWLVTAFLITASISTPIAGRFGDMYGKRLMLMISFAIFAGGCAVCVIGDSIGQLIAGRAIAGLGAGIVPLALGSVRDVLPRERVALGIGAVSSTLGVGGGLGLVSSGLIVDHASVHWVFGGSIPAALIVMLGVWLYVPESPSRAPARIDWLGALLLSAGLLSLLIGVSRGNAWGWASAPVLALFAGSLVIGLLWVLWERRVRDPMVDMRVMSDRAVWTTNVVTLAAGFGMFASFMLVPQYVQTSASTGYGFGASGSATGLFMLPHSLFILVSGTLAGVLGTRFGSKVPLAIGTVASGAAYLGFAFLHQRHFEIYLGTAMMGFGVGLTLSSVANLTVEAVSQHQTGIAVAMNAIMRMIAGAMGAQAAAAILTASSGPGGLPTETGFTAAFAMAAAAALIPLGVIRWMPGHSARTEPRPVAVEAISAQPL